MKMLQKWDYTTRCYIQLPVPDDWNCLTISEDMETVINCPHCGKTLKYGDGYTSMEIYSMLFGYIVCEKCYQEEIRRRRRNNG